MTSRCYISPIRKERDPEATRLPYSTGDRCLARRCSINLFGFRTDSRHKPGARPNSAASPARTTEAYTDLRMGEALACSTQRRKRTRKFLLKLTANWRRPAMSEPSRPRSTMSPPVPIPAKPPGLWARNDCGRGWFPPHCKKLFAPHASLAVGPPAGCRWGRARSCATRTGWLGSAPSLDPGIGEVAEWSNAPHSKCGIPARVSGVRIPPSPPPAFALRAWAPDVPGLKPSREIPLER